MTRIRSHSFERAEAYVLEVSDTIAKMTLDNNLNLAEKLASMTTLNMALSTLMHETNIALNEENKEAGDD